MFLFVITTTVLQLTDHTCVLFYIFFLFYFYFFFFFLVICPVLENPSIRTSCPVGESFKAYLILILPSPRPWKHLCKLKPSIYSPCFHPPCGPCNRKFIQGHVCRENDLSWRATWWMSPATIKYWMRWLIHLLFLIISPSYLICNWDTAPFCFQFLLF